MALPSLNPTREEMKAAAEAAPTPAELNEAWNFTLEPVESDLGAPDPEYGAWSAGADQMHGLGWRFVQMAGDMLDIEAWEEVGKTRAEANFELASSYKRQALLESEGMSDFGKWVHDTVKTQIPMMAPSILAAGTLGILATIAGAPAAVVTAGVGLGAYVPNFILNAGEAYSKQIEAGGKVDPKVAAMTGALAAVLDSLVPGKVAGGIIGRGKSFSSHIAKKMADGSVVGNQFKRAFKFGFWEGATEGTQEAIMQMARDYVNDKSYGFTKEDRAEIIEGIAAGFLMGGGIGVGTPAGTGRAREQVKSEDELKAAREEAKATVRSDRDAAIYEVHARKKSNRKELNAAQKEINEIKKTAREKIKSLGGAKTIDEVYSIVPIATEEAVSSPEALQEELASVDKQLAEARILQEAERAKPRGRAPNRILIRVNEEIETLEARKNEINSLLGDVDTTEQAAPPPIPQTLEDAQAEVERIDAEINSIKEKVSVRKTTADRKKKGYSEQEASELAGLEARRKEVQLVIDNNTEKTTAPVEDAVETTTEEGPYTPTGPELSTQIETKIAEIENSIVETETAIAEAGAGVSAFNRRRITTQLRKKLADQKAERDRLLAMQRTPDQITWSDVAVQEAPADPTVEQRLEAQEEAGFREAARDRLLAIEQNRLATAERNRLEAEARAQARAEDEAAAAADAAEADALIAAETELADLEAQLAAQLEADAAARADDPVINVTGPSTLTNKDIAVGSAAVQQAKQRAWNLRKRTGRRAERDRVAAEAETARNDENIARQAEELKARRQEQKADAATVRAEKVQTDKALREELKVEAANLADDTIDSFRLNPRSEADMILDMERGAATVLDNAARREYTKIVREGIGQIKAERKVEETEAKRAKEQATTDEAGTVTAGNTQEQITALEELIAQHEGIIDIMVKSGITTDKADPKAYSIPELQEQLEEKSRNERILGRLRERADQEAAVKPSPAKKKTTKKAPSKVVPTGRVEEAAPTTESEATLKAADEAVDSAKAEPGIKGIRKAIGNLSEKLGIERDEAGTLFVDAQLRQVAVDEEQTADEQTQEMIDKERVTVAREAEEQAERAREEQAAEDTGPPEPSIQEEIDLAEEQVRILKGEVPGPNEVIISGQSWEPDGVPSDEQIDEAEQRIESNIAGNENLEEIYTDDITWTRKEVASDERIKEAEQVVTDLKKVATVTPKQTTRTDAKKAKKAKKGSTTVQALEKGVATEPDITTKQNKTTYKTFRQNRAGTAWTARINNVPAKISIDEVGEFHATYGKISNPVPFTSLDAAKIHLLDTYGTTAEKKKIPGRKAPAKVAKATTTKAAPEPRKQKYAEEVVNSENVPVQIQFDPVANSDKPHLVLVRGEPFKRYAKRERARYVANRVTDADVEKELIRIQAARMRGDEEVARGEARRGAAIQRGQASQPGRAAVVLSPSRMVFSQMPLPKLNEKKRTNNPNVKIDSDLEKEVIEEATGLEGNSVTVSYEERDLRGPDTQKRTSFKESEVSGSRFNTFTPFMVPTKEEAQALSASIYSNPEEFRMFLANEISTRAGLDPKTVSMGVINDAEAFKMQQSYQRRVDKLLKGETARRRLTDEQRSNIEKWRQKIKDLNTNEGRNFKSTVVPGSTQADFDDSLTRWVDLLEDRGVDVGYFKDNLSIYTTPPTKKKVDEEVVDEVETDVVDEAVTVDGIEYLKSKVAAGEKLSVAHVGATDLEGMTDDSLRNMDMRDDLGKKLGEGGIGGFPSNKIDPEITVSLAAGSNFLEWTGNADIVVLHRIPDEATADALRRTGREDDLGAGPTVPEGHNLESWTNAIVDSDASLVYIWGSGSTGDFNGLDFQRVPGYDMVGKWNLEGEMGSGQYAVLNKVAAEEVVDEEQTADVAPTTTGAIETQEDAEWSELAELARTDNLRFNPRTGDYERIPDSELADVTEEGEMSEAEFNKLFGWGIADEESALEAQYARERKERSKSTAEEKVSVAFIIANENPAELSSKLNSPPSQGGYSADEVKSLAANIKAENPEFNYNPKGKKEDITASVMEWYTSPMEYTPTKEDLIKTSENDDVVESRRMDDVTTFYSPSQAERIVRSQVRSIFGDKGTRRLEEIGFINFIESSEAKKMGASDAAQAFVSRGDGVVYFIRDKLPSNMTDRDVRGLIFHEVGVHFGRDIFSGSEWNIVLDELYKLGRDGDDVVNVAVARVMKNYGYKKFDSGRPFDPKNRHLNFQGRREFWEEVLAHVVEIKQPVLNSPSRKGLIDKIKNAFKTFFNKIFKANMDVSNVTLDDVVNLIGYSTWHSGIMALDRHGDSKKLSRFRDRKRKEFLEGSAMKDVVYHGTSKDWSSPLIDRTQLGLHVGTSLAAINIIPAEHFANKPVQEYESFMDMADEVEAWKPGWESKISNRDLDNIAISWDPKLRLRTSDSLADMQEISDALGMEKEISYTWFESGANIKQGYINIQNPFIMGDIGNFSTPPAWFTHANRAIAGEVGYSMPEAQLETWLRISNVARAYATELSVASESGNIVDVFDVDAKFSKELRSILIEEGYDSIEYVNDAEDVGSTSWILLDNNQFKSIDDLSFDSSAGIFSTKKAIGQSNSSEIVESRRMAREAGREVVKSRVGTARANAARKWLQRRIEPLMAVEGYDILETKRMLTKGKVGEWANTGRIVFDVLNEATAIEKKAIYKYFTTRNADPSKLPTRKVKFAEHRTVVRGTRAGPTAPSVSIKEKVIETKKEIASMGERLVTAGLITDAQYAEWKNQYLPRVYMEHVMGGRDRIGIGGLRASSLTYTKHRKDHENFLNDVISGRIDDPAFLAGRYLTMAGSDLAIIEYLSYIASDPGNNKWVLPGQIMTFRNMIGTSAYFKNLASDISTRANAGKKVDPARAAEMLELSSEMNAAADQVSVDMRGLNMDRYRKVPDSPRYGAMRELWVHKDIWNDINGLGVAGNPSWGTFLKWSGRAQTTFKYTKVPMNIPTQVRNMISNAILMNVSGTNFLRIPGAVSRAIHDVTTNGKYMQLARKYGLETTTFAATELGQIDRELATVKARGESFEGMWARARIFFNDYGDVGGRAYQKTEVLFKVAKMIDLMENHGKKEAEAAKLANEALLDYGNVSQGIRMLRTLPLGSPFITFNAKVVAQMARNIKQHPFATLKYAALPYLLMEMFLSQNDDLDEEDWDSLMKFLPDYMETSMSTMVFPYKDDEGRWQAWDVSFFLPWGAHTQLAKNVATLEFGEAVYRNIGMFTGPAELPVALKLNKDPFTGQPIYNEYDSVQQRYEDMLAFVASYMVPPMLMPRNKAGAIVSGGGPLIKTMMAADFIDGNVDRNGLPRYDMPDALLSWFGVNFQKMGPQDISRALYFKQRDLDKIESRYKQIMRDPSLSREKRLELQKEYKEHWLKILQEHREWAEGLKRYQRLFE